MTHKTISEKSIAVMSDLLIDYFNDGNPIEKSSDLDGILTIFAMAGTNLEIDARRSGAEAMRAQCAALCDLERDDLASLDNVPMKGGSEIAWQLAKRICELPLDAPAPEQEQVTK